MHNRIQFKEMTASLWNTLGSWEIPVHSLLVSAGGELLWEAYYPPYQADTLHRMFSITKSCCSLAVGCLAAQDKLKLDDPVIRFFPEYVPAGTLPHPYLAEMTIRHMLMMQTCHSDTTYKQNPDRNWVESFFLTPPTHKSGQIFLYDSSASHTLAALVKKLTGMGVLDYLRTYFPDDAGFSKDAYIILDPFGAEMGGCGLMARPKDLMITAQYLMKQLHNGTDAFSDYLREAVSRQTPTLHFGQTLDEQQGYGYQFWRIRDGFAMYGMGGQYVLFYPERELIVVITADSQNIKGGTQKILDAVYETLALNGGAGACSYSYSAGSAGGVYRLLPNDGGFTELTVSVDSREGLLTLKNPDATYQIPFGCDNTLRTAVIAKYNQPIASTGTWLDEHSLLVDTQLVGECVGSLTFMMRFRSDGVTLWMKKVEETFFCEFCGFAEGVLSCCKTADFFNQI